ncbi:hypothetical protein JD844_018839 [Phrynosoma platyrhinos]|uniref:Uncharacterized protein n=1 Tax=Phrynosoma platyrhinos TaxID=52577 RepID=A0ABQ7SPA8_PHRPL|nr:hypothetical protein JD844_018839 [Phrynosoma platyrhinos]
MAVVVVDFLILTAKVIGYVLHALIRWIKKPREKTVRNEICLITGTASSVGVGRLFALEFARRGATLVLWDVDTKGNENTAREVRKLGAKAYTYTCDVSQRELVYATASCVRREVGDVTILINNAGIIAGMPILQCPDEQVERTMKTNCHAHFWTVKAFLPQMIKRGHGHIVTIAGSLGLFATGCLEQICNSFGLKKALNAYAGREHINSFSSADIFSSRRELKALLPPIKPDHFVKAAMQGILRNQHMICIPKVMYFAAISKNLLPWDVQVLIQKFLGLDRCIPQKAAQ